MNLGDMLEYSSLIFFRLRKKRKHDQFTEGGWFYTCYSFSALLWIHLFLWSWNPRPVGFSSHGADGESLLWICESLAGKQGLESLSLDFLAGKGGRPPCCLVLFVLMSLGHSYPLLIPSHFVLHPLASGLQFVFCLCSQTESTWMLILPVFSFITWGY